VGKRKKTSAESCADLSGMKSLDYRRDAGDSHFLAHVLLLK
jgi:hypothetical protein